MSEQNQVPQSEDQVYSNKQLMESPEIKKVAEKVIADKKMEFGPAEIGYMLVYPNISRKRAAKTIKASAEVRFYSGNHYIIQVSGELWDMLDEKTKEILIFHELMQVEPVFKSRSGQWKMQLRKPDFSDFYTINDKHGNEWYKTIQATVSSLYGLDPRQESKVKT